jgi:hypothetical protein
VREVRLLNKGTDAKNRIYFQYLTNYFPSPSKYCPPRPLYKRCIRIFHSSKQCCRSLPGTLLVGLPFSISPHRRIENELLLTRFPIGKQVKVTRCYVGRMRRCNSSSFHNFRQCYACDYVRSLYCVHGSVML